MRSLRIATRDLGLNLPYIDLYTSFAPKKKKKKKEIETDP